MFSTETDLHKCICEFFLQIMPGDDIIVESEINGLFGIPDIVIAESISGKVGNIIALELKLSSWQRALKQAFRYRSFAWESYVVIDKKRSKAAASNLEVFKKYNVGLATFSVNGEFNILYTPEIKTPYSVGLFRKLCSHLVRESSAKSEELFVPPCRNFGLGRKFQDLHAVNFGAI